MNYTLSVMAEKKESKADEEIKDFCQDRVIRRAADVADFLEQVALDNSYRDRKVVKNKETGMLQEVEAPVPINVRVTAAKTWKEMVMDKAVGDVKEKAKEQKPKGLNMKAALEAVGKEMRAAQREEEDIL